MAHPPAVSDDREWEVSAWCGFVYTSDDSVEIAIAWPTDGEEEARVGFLITWNDDVSQSMHGWVVVRDAALG
jgi:hypothetical protein